MYGGLSLVVSFSTISLYAAATTEWTERDRERHPLNVIEVQVLVGTPVGCLADLEVGSQQPGSLGLTSDASRSRLFLIPLVVGFEGRYLGP
jgi:hypothetical protein